MGSRWPASNVMTGNRPDSAMGILLLSCKDRFMVHCVTSRSTRVSVQRSPDSVNGSMAPSATILTRYCGVAAKPRSVPIAAI